LLQLPVGQGDEEDDAHAAKKQLSATSRSLFKADKKEEPFVIVVALAIARDLNYYNL